MKYYIFLNNKQLMGAGQCKQLTEGVENIEVNEELYNNFVGVPKKYIYLNGEIVEDSNYKETQSQKEHERLNMLSLTAADVERAIYKVKGLDFDDILELVKDKPSIDSKALKIELKANNFYRGNPYVSAVGNILGFTEEQLDRFFETGEYEELM